MTNAGRTLAVIPRSTSHTRLAAAMASGLAMIKLSEEAVRRTGQVVVVRQVMRIEGSTTQQFRHNLGAIFVW
jgi:hypothetical protein